MAAVALTALLAPRPLDGSLNKYMIVHRVFLFAKEGGEGRLLAGCSYHIDRNLKSIGSLGGRSQVAIRPGRDQAPHIGGMVGIADHVIRIVQGDKTFWMPGMTEEMACVFNVDNFVARRM